MAVNKTYQIMLDVKNDRTLRPPKLVEGDNGNIFIITLQDGATPVSVANCHILAVFSSERGTAIQDSEEATEGITFPVCTDSNQIRIALLPSSYGAGTNSCEIQVYSDSDATLITTARFTFEASRALFGDGEVVSTEQYSVLQRLINLLTDMTANATTLSSSESATATVTETDGAIRIDFGIPRGADGEGSTVDNIAAQDGNINLSAVRYVEQSLTNEQKEQARANIEAAPMRLGTVTVTSIQAEHYSVLNEQHTASRPLNASDVGAEPIRTSVTVPDLSAWIDTALTAGRYLVNDGSYDYYVEIVVDGIDVFQEYWSSEETERYTYYRAGTVSGDTVTWNDWSYNMTNSMMTDYAQKTYVDTAIETAIGSAIGGGY